MAEEKRKIQLADGEPDGTHGFGSHTVTAKVGQPVAVDETTARVAVESGRFVYAPETIELYESKGREARGELPPDFPARSELAIADDPITTVEELKNTSDAELLAHAGIGEKMLGKIRKAEKKV